MKTITLHYGGADEWKRFNTTAQEFERGAQEKQHQAMDSITVTIDDNWEEEKAVRDRIG